jgi:nitric oxide dioxygenase
MRTPNHAVTPDTVLAVRASWPAIARQADALTRRFYRNLFGYDPSAARLFRGVDMTAQRARLVQALTVVVRALDDIDRLLPPLIALGSRHSKYGVESHHFDSVGRALIQALSETLGEEFTPEVRAAWGEAYGVIASVMRRAMSISKMEIA